MIEDAKQLGAFRWLGWALVHLAHSQISSGECAKSLETSRLAAEASKIAGDEELVLQAVIAEFKSYLSLGYFEDALQSAFERLHRSSIGGADRHRTRALSEIAWTYHEMGQDARGLEYAVEALNNAEGLPPDPDLLFLVHNTLGAIHTSLGHSKLAFAHLGFAHEIISEGKGESWNSIVLEGLRGNACIAAGQLHKAREHLEKRFSLADKLEYQSELAAALADLGKCHFLLGDYEISYSCYRRAFDLAAALSQQHVMMDCGLQLAVLHQIANQDSQALHWASKILPDQYDKPPGNSGVLVKPSWLVDRDDVYEQKIGLLCRSNRIFQSLQTAEQRRVARGLYPVGIPQRSIIEWVPSPLRDRFAQLKLKIRRLYLNLAEFPSSEFSADNTSQRLLLESEMMNLEIEYRKFIVEANIASGLYATISDPKGLWLKTLRDSVLAVDQALLEYVVGAGQTEAFLLKRDTLLHFTVKKSREELYELVGRLSYLFEKNASGVSLANATLANFDPRISSELYRLLVQPVEHELDEVHRLVIVPDDPLERLPFEILIRKEVEGNSFDHGRVEFMVESFEINYAPAAMFLILNRDAERDPDKVLLAFGSLLVPPSAGTSAFPGEGVQIFPNEEPRQLAGVQKELMEIQKVFGEDVNLLSGKSATKTDFLEVAAEYRVLHIAGHVTSEPEMPLESSIYVGPMRGGTDSERIRAFEITDLQLNAELAVLSGCNTGYSGNREGVGGLVQAFMRAGVPSVVASLWTVDDEATAELMGRFYDYLHRGERKARALQLAKIDLIKSGKSDPYYWGAFVLFGENSPVVFTGAKNSIGLAVAGGSLLLVAIMGLLLRRVFRNAKRIPAVRVEGVL